MTSYGPAASLVEKLTQDHHIEVTMLSAQEHAQACSSLVDTINEGTSAISAKPNWWRHPGGRNPRPLGDAWAWSRKHSSANISPLVSVTLALSAAMTAAPKKAVFAWA